MTEFEYLARGKGSPYGRQRVYFTCHPNDFDSCFDEISQIVLKKYDCTIWYYRDSSDDEKEYALRISEMQLFIIPITQNFLLGQCRARNFDLPFALEHNIPVLLLMQTPGLDEPFAKECGDLHYIDKNACDGTTLTYEQKIHKFLSMTLVSDELIQKIREAFYARIFLSYRKKDRILANKLMGLIHDIPFCRDIAIWFDEYLVPGQSFNNAIAEAMRSSQLFVLCVTETLVEEGNYVQTTEYPKARELSLPIMPIAPEEMTPEQIKLLKEKYVGIPECIDSDNLEQLTSRFYMSFTDIAVAARADDPMHLFFIGLAYLNGIEVEVDHSRATDLITQAANQNYWPAMEKLANMYKIGEGVVRNSEKSLVMYENLIKEILGNSDDKKLLDVHCDLLRLLLDSGLLFRYKHMDCLKRHTMSAMEVASKLKLSSSENFKIYSLLAFVNEHDERVADKFIKEALRFLPEVYEDDDQTLAEEAFFYSQLASMYYQRSAGLIVYHFSTNPIHAQRGKLAEQYITKAIGLLQNLYEKDPIRWKVNYVDALYIFCSMNYSQPFCDDLTLVEAIEHAIELYRELCKDNAVLYATKLAALCRDSGDYLAYDIDIVWETTWGFRLDLNSENYVPGMPEQQIPPRPALEDGSEEYDFRRIRKALSLMRYSVALYEDYIAKGQDDCWLDLAQTYFCLSRLLHCLSEWARNIQEDDIEEICVRLLKDSFDGYRKMLAAIRKCALIISVKHYNFECERDSSSNQSNGAGGQLSEKDLVEFERRAYEINPFAECYNFAVGLSDNGLDEESMLLHEELYRFFKEVHHGADPVLVSMNLYAYACSKSDVDEVLSLLLEIDDTKKKMECSQSKRNGILFDYYYKIAQCYTEKGDPIAADGYFAKAKKAKSYFTPYQHARFNMLWATSKKDAEDLVGSEKLVWEGLECLMSMEDMPADLWNELSCEYASLLIRMGREKEANAWLKEMLVD